MANMENLLRAPPENRSRRPNRFPLVKSRSIMAALTPGTGICVPALNTMNIARVKNTFFRSSVAFNRLSRADAN